MRYKVGDKVKMKKEEPDFGHNAFLEKTNYILTIKDADECYYEMEEDPIFHYLESSIECLARDYKKDNKIKNRFEILDIR